MSPKVTKYPDGWQRIEWQTEVVYDYEPGNSDIGVVCKIAHPLQYTVEDCSLPADVPANEVLAGPFPTLQAAKAACLILIAVNQ